MFPHSGEIFSITCAFFWALAVVYFKKSGESIPPLQLNLFKDAVSLLLFLPTMLALGRPLWPEGSAAHAFLLLASGALGIGLADTIFLKSLNLLGATRSAIVDCLYSPLVIICSFFYLHEPLGPNLLAALVLMTAAILLGNLRPERQEKDYHPRDIRNGLALGALSMLLMAVGIVMAKPALNRTPPLWATTVRICGGLAPLVLFAVFPGQLAITRRVFTPGAHWRPAFIASLFGSYLAMFFWVAGMKYTFTNIASVLNQLSTVFTPLLAVPILGEQLGPRKAVAVFLAFFGALVLFL
jgi:drug/metabolite transporter (DMT)-like permease